MLILMQPLNVCFLINPLWMLVIISIKSTHFLDVTLKTVEKFKIESFVWC